MFILWLGILSILGSSVLQCLRHPVVRRRIKKVFNWELEWWFDTISFYLIPVLTVIGLIAISVTYHARKLAEEALHETRTKVMTLEERESLRKWVMITPTGRIAKDSIGVQSDGGGTMEERHKKIFTEEGLKFSFGGPIKCADDEYIKGIRELIRYYPKLPYAYVALTWCLKERGDSSWEEAGEKARNLLEKLIVINPRVTHIDGYYGMLMHALFGRDLEGTGYFKLSEEGIYVPTK
jgi:hypothetical protein